MGFICNVNSLKKYFFSPSLLFQTRFPTFPWTTHPNLKFDSTPNLLATHNPIRISILVLRFPDVFPLYLCFLLNRKHMILTQCLLSIFRLKFSGPGPNPPPYSSLLKRRT